MAERLLLDERIRADGAVARCWGSIEGDRFRVCEDDGVDGTLSIAALDRVMCRYARELDPAIALDGESSESPGSAGARSNAQRCGEWIDAGAGRRLRRLRHRAAVDADARDYLVWERPGAPPIAVIATMATAALRYLVLRLADERVHGESQESEG